MRDLRQRPRAVSSASCPAATAASRWPMPSSSISASEFDWDVELALPGRRGQAGPARASGAARLDELDGAELGRRPTGALRRDARFHPAGSLRRAEAAPRRRTLKGTTMADISLEAVTGKLNRVGYDTFIQALRQAKGAGNRNVELAHWLLHILQKERTDLALTADHFKLDRARLLDGSRRRRRAASARTRPRCPASPTRSSTSLDRGWHYATLFFGETQIRTGHLLVAALKSIELRRALVQPLHGVRQDPGRRARRRAIAQDLGAVRTRRTCGRWTAPACARPGRRAPRRPHGAEGHDGARPLLAGPDRQGRSPARWTRSSAATTRSARSSTC